MTPRLRWWALRRVDEDVMFTVFSTYEGAV